MVASNTTPAVKATTELCDPSMFEADSGSGFEEAGKESYAVPFLRQIQGLSPQLKRKEDTYIEGAEEGDFFNTVTDALFKGDDGVEFIPCYFRRIFNMWAPNRGGFRGSVDQAEGERMLRTCDRDADGNDVLPDGNHLIDTREHYGIIVSPDGTSMPAVFTCSSSQIKHSKKWMTQMQNVCLPSGSPAPMFSQVYKLVAITEKNDQGTWAGFKPVYQGFVQDAKLYKEASLFRTMVRSGEAQAVEPTDITSDSDATDDVAY